MVDFTEGPARAGFFSPERFEADVYDCEVEGLIPPDLDGAFVRVGGSWFYPGKNGDTNPFSAEGYVSAFRIRKGIADYKGRWVRTPRFLNNLAQRRQLYGRYRNPATNDPAYQKSDQPYLGTVQNTAPLAHGGKLFTLKEDALPYRYVYSGIRDTSKPFDTSRAGQIGNNFMNSYFRFDLETRDLKTYFAGDTHSLQEVSFIPRNAGAPEGDGFLMGIANNFGDMRSELVIVDAQELEEIARVFLPFRSTAQVHGRWVSANELPFSEHVIPPYTGRVQTASGIS